MTLWKDFRDGTLRILLRDTAAEVHTWDDATLLAFANVALREVSTHAPTIKTVNLTADGRASTFILPSDMLTLLSLLWDTGSQKQVVESFDIFTDALPYPATPSTGPLGYLLDWPGEGELTLTRIPTRNLQLRYLAYRGPLVADTDVLPFGSRTWLEQALAFYIGYLAHVAQGITRASLSQWSEKPELNVGNPLNDEAKYLYEQYVRIVALNKDRN